MTSTSQPQCPAHGVFIFDDDVVFSSNFDNGNLARVDRGKASSFEFRIWTAPDNMGTSFQSKHNAWFHFVVSGVPSGSTLRMTIVNASPHSGLYKHDMRPVYRSNSTNHKWCRIKTSVRMTKADESAPMQLSFDYNIESTDDKIYFAFTYPYTYAMVQADLATMDPHVNNLSDPNAIFWYRELVNLTRDGRRIDLLTISSCEGANFNQREPLLSGLFPDAPASPRGPSFPNKDIIFVSARVHPGEVPAQWTLKGMISMLLDKDDLVARELRRRYVIKIIPMLNPDGVFRGHFRMDQFGQNLNRYYVEPDPVLQGPILGAKKLIDQYASEGRLCMYMDLHAHASKRGCFIYGNVMDKLEDQVQNMLFCRLIAMNTAHFDYEGCLFSREHMTRIDPGDQAKGLTAEGSSRVATYLAHGLVHSYTLECNYNTSKTGNEVSPTEGDPGGLHSTSTASFCSYPDKFTPSSYAGVGRACLVALLDLRGQNPFSRVFRSKYKTLERVRQTVVGEVRQRKEYKMQVDRSSIFAQKRVHTSRSASPSEEPVEWKRTVSSAPELCSSTGPPPASSSSSSSSSSFSSSAPAPAGGAIPQGQLQLQSQHHQVPLTVHELLLPLEHVGAGLGELSPTLRKAALRPEHDGTASASRATYSGSGSGSSPTDGSSSSPNGGTRSPRAINLSATAALPGSPKKDSPPSAFGSFGIRLKPTSNVDEESTAWAEGAAPGFAPQRPPRSGPMLLSGSSGSSSSSAGVGGRHGILTRVGRPGMAKLLMEAASGAVMPAAPVAALRSRTSERKTDEQQLSIAVPLSSRQQASSRGGTAGKFRALASEASSGGRPASLSSSSHASRDKEGVALSNAASVGRKRAVSTIDIKLSSSSAPSAQRNNPPANIFGARVHPAILSRVALASLPAPLPAPSHGDLGGGGGRGTLSPIRTSSKG